MNSKADCVSKQNGLIALALVGVLSFGALAGCGNSGQAEGPSNTNEPESVSEPTGTVPSSTDEQTAPMPENPITEDQILGKWSPDPNSSEPEYIDFFYRDGRLYYYYYRELLGNGSGIGIGKGTTEFEYDQGVVAFYGNQGRCSCLRYFGGGETAIDFLLFDIADGVIRDQKDGEGFSYVGPSTEDDHTLYDLEGAAGY